MRACLHSLSLVHCALILSNSESGMLASPPNFFHRPSLMMSRTVERFSGVRLASGNTTGERKSCVTKLLVADNARQVFLLHASHDCTLNWGVTLTSGVPYRSHTVPFPFRSVYTVRGVSRGVKVSLLPRRKPASLKPASLKPASLKRLPRRVFRDLGRLLTTRRSPGKRFSKEGVAPDC